MSRRCEKCGRGPRAGATRSHSNIKSKRRVYVNLQSKVVNGKRIKICTKCIKTMAKKSK